MTQEPLVQAKHEYQARLVAALRQLRGAECDTRVEMQEIQVSQAGATKGHSRPAISLLPR